VQILSKDARDCGEFCSKTSPIAAAHGARISISKAHGARTSIFKEAYEKQAIPYSNHKNWKKTEHFSDVDIQ
jgi:hypothetical protein